MDKIINIVLAATTKEAEEIKKSIIDSLESDLLTESKVFWQVEHIVNELIEEIERDMLNDEIISDEESLKNIIDNLDRNIEFEIFDILIDPVIKHFKNNDIDIDRHFETVTIYN